MKITYDKPIEFKSFKDRLAAVRHIDRKMHGVKIEIVDGRTIIVRRKL